LLESVFPLTFWFRTAGRDWTETKEQTGLGVLEYK
jgi:hypothetical protein